MRRAGACAAEIDRFEVCLCVAEVECEAPNNVLSKFEGVLTWRHQAYALDNDKVSSRPYIFTFSVTGCLIYATIYQFMQILQVSVNSVHH